MSFPKYAKYKDSGVEWLGEVPEHWDCASLTRIARRVVVGIAEAATHAYVDEGIPILRSTNVRAGRIIGEILFLDPAFAGDRASKRIAAGDLVTVRTGNAGVTAVVPAEFDGCQCFTMLITSLNDGESVEFYCYWMNSVSAQCFFRLEGWGTAQVNISVPILKALPVPIPPRSEQLAIAAFLDHESAKIDGLVGEQRRLIELLKEKRQAVISHAVTKGLNPHAPMKPSGIEWLGNVPEHWNVGPLKRYWSVTDCKHVTAEFVEDGIPLASIREVQDRWVALENAKCTTEHFYELLIEGNRKPLPGDLIFTRNATVGEVAQVHGDHPRFAMGQDVCLLRKLSPDWSSDYLQHVIRSPIIIQQLANLMIGSTFKRINVEEIRTFVVPAPPPAEQAEIAAFLECGVVRSDELITEAQHAIELLQERRTALISAAVTGKIDVRGLVATEAA